ncbi:MAG: Tfp pilus assembly protein FimT/FimU [Pseudomonadales bacterium]
MSRRQHAQGFTIVELVVVIILLGILSVAAVSRMVSPSDFAPGMVSATTASQFRYARALAFAREDTDVQFMLAIVGSDWQITSSTGADGTLRSEEIEQGDTTVQLVNGAFTGSVSVLDPLRITFASDGGLAAASLGTQSLDPDLGLRLQISGDSSRLLCVYPNGYLFTADCV